MSELSTRERKSPATLVRIVVGGVLLGALAVGVSSVVTTLSATPGSPHDAALAATSPVAPVASSVPASGPVSYSPVVEKVAPAVVTIRVEKVVEATPTSIPAPFHDFFGPQGRAVPRGREGGLGSGVVIRADGLILTNHHVIADASKIRVDTSDGRTYQGTLVGSDPASDLAVVRIKATGLPTVPFGDSDRMKVGDVVLAFGNPLGVGQTVTMGIVSAKGRATGVSDGSYEDFLQTDAPINQGNSGGALVNLQGELVGINAQIVSPSGGNVGLGFAIPSSMARAVSDQLTRDGVVHRAKLGVTVQGLTPELAESLGLPNAHGAIVSSVESGSPAQKAGLRQGDVVTALDGKPVSDANALRNQIANMAPGSAVTIDVRRDERSQTLTATLVERERRVADARPTGDAEQGESALGMSIQPLTPRVAEQLELPRTTTGLVVTDIDPAGRAAAAGLREGDVIKAVNGREVDSVSSLRTALRAQSKRPALMLVSRGGADTFVALPRAES